MTYGLASSNEQAICSMTVFASAHIADHRSARQAHTWRRQLSQRAPAVRGLRWLKAMTTLGDARQGGFAVVPNRLRRQFAIAAWDSPEDFEAFYAGSPLADAWHHDCDYAWHVLLKPWRSSGSFNGSDPFGELETPEPESGPIGVLTLGRCPWRRLSAFTGEGTALTSRILGANGLITALTAGFPVSGNATFSLWERTDDMRRFAYGPRGEGHGATIDADRRRGILEEQIRVRFVPLAIRGNWDPSTTPNSDAVAGLASRLQSKCGGRVGV
jgi:hypothetical protein